jgi:peptide/nickel transport system substrate-binding protein
MYRRALLGATAGVVLAAPSAAVAQASRKELTIGVKIETMSIDPHFFNTSANYNIVNHVFEFLVMKDHADGPRNHLAESLRRLDERTWEMKLRRDVRWETGEALTADDVLFNVERGRSGDLRSVSPTTRFIIDKEFRLIDDHTLHIVTEGPNPLLDRELSVTPIVSRRHGRGMQTADYNSGRATIGTGPYRFVRWTPGDRVVLDRNPNFRGPAGEWDRITYRVLTSDATRVASLLAGNVDLINDVPVSDVALIRADSRFTVTAAASNRTIFLNLDLHREVSPFVKGPDGADLDHNPLRKPLVRAALTHAIDRAAIVGRLMEGQAVPAGQFAIPGMFGHVPDIEAPAFDPARARQMLAEAGYPNGFRLTAHGPNGRYVNDARVLQAVAQMFSRIGVTTQVQTEPWSTYAGNAANYSVFLVAYGSDTGEGSAALTSILATPNRARNRGAVNRGRYSNASFDDLLERALVELDDPRREALLQEATRLALKTDIAVMPLYWQMNIWAHRRELTMTPRVDERTYGYQVGTRT